MQGRGDDRSLGELFSELSQETTTLIRQEVNLAKTEMSQKASRVGKDVGFMAAGGAVAYAGLLAIVAGVIALVGLVIPLWLSALLVGLVVAAIGYFLVRKGLDALKQEDLAPRQTIETLKEDKEWAKDQTDRTR
ncbi:MAG: phage holin family protein [Actinomycetota bacterium]|nr:phage holin family protein [Actinomycetota bacterium]